MVTKKGTKLIKSGSYVVWEREKSKNTCVQCAGRNGNLYRTVELEAIWPAHPNCLCRLTQSAAVDVETISAGGLHCVQVKAIMKNEVYRNSIMRAAKRYGNSSGVLPAAEGRKYYYVSAGEGDGSFVIFSNDGLGFVTYNGFKNIYPVENQAEEEAKARRKEETFFDGFAEEMLMFRENEMAPMAYTYIMQNIYDWYLSDSTAERAMIERRLALFRETGYKKTGVEFYDEGIEALGKKPPIAKVFWSAHYFRNKLNIEYEWNDLMKLNDRLPKKYRWYQMEPHLAREHQNAAPEGKPNKKYTSFDGYFEAVYSYDNVLLNEETASLDMGTYNYHPVSFDHLGFIDHGFKDLFSYYLYTNTQKDLDQRKEDAREELKKKKQRKKLK